MKHVIRVMLVLFISISISGCQNQREPSPNLLYSQCRKVVNHIIETYDQQYNVYTPDKNRAYLVEACQQYPLSATEYICVMAASTYEAIQACLISSVSLP